MITETSREAFKKLRDLGEKQQQVHGTLGELGVASNQDVANKLGWPINRVTGRMKELRDYGFVVVHGLKVNEFGNSVKTWCVSDPYAQKKIDLAKDVADEIEPKKYEAVRWQDD